MQPDCDLCGVEGKVLASIARVLYEHGGQLDTSDGPVELRFEDGGTLLLDGGSDGETLRTSSSPWRDPFAGQLSAANRAYIQEHGRWTRVDLSNEDAYRDLVGNDVVEMAPLFNEFGRLSGVKLATFDRTMWFVIEGDECHVRWAPPIGFSEKRSTPERGSR